MPVTQEKKRAPQFTTADMPYILQSMYNQRDELVPCFIGAPGVGKTQAIYKFADDIGKKVVTFILSNAVPSEVSGIRMPDQDTKTLVTFDDARMASLEDGDILFFDEILEAPPMLWSSILTLIQDRMMASGRKLPDVFIVAASNPVCNPSIVPASVRDRFQWIELAFDFDGWKAWFAERFGVEPPARLASMLQSESTGYNVLTPRRYTKLYHYYTTDTGRNYEIIAKMFGEDIADTFREAAAPKRKVDSAFIIAELASKGIVLDEAWDDLTLAEMFEAIKNHPQHDAIEAALRSMTY